MRWLLALILSAGLAQAQEFTTLKGHGGPIMGIAVSPDGQVASASFDNSVGLWVDTSPTWLEGHEAAVIALDYSQAPFLVSGGDDFRVLAWNTKTKTSTELYKHQGKVADIAVWQRSIATAGWDGFVNILVGDKNAPLGAPLFDGTTHVVLDGHRSNVTAVGFSSDGRLFSASSDGTLRVWEGKGTELRPRTIVKHGFGINEMIVQDDWIAYGAVDGGTRVVDPETGEQIADFTLDRRPILAMAYHAASGQIAVGDGHGYIMMLDATTWRITRDFRATRKGPVWALAFSPDGTQIYAGGLDDVVYAWPVALLDQFDASMGQERSFLRAPDTMPNGERQFMRKCSICHALTAGPSRKAGPSLHGLFGRPAGTVDGYFYSDILDGSDIVWDETSIDALFDEGPDHYIPGSKMPMQVIAKSQDRADLIAFLKEATKEEGLK